MKPEGQHSSQKAQKTFQAMTSPSWKSTMCPIGAAIGFSLANFDYLERSGFSKDVQERKREARNGEVGKL